MAGKTYYYAVRAVNATGVGPWTLPVQVEATPGNPDAPALTATVVDDDSIRLNWNEPDAHGITITGYELQRWDPTAGNGGDWNANHLLGDDYTITEYINIGLDPGVQHYYRVRAMPQTDSDEGWSANEKDDGASATTLGATPTAPLALAAARGTDPDQDTIALTWNVPATDNGFPVTGYELSKWNGSAWVVHEASLPATPRSYTDKDLARGSKHYYLLRAMNSQGVGASSNFANATTAAAAPDVPVLTLTATGTTTIQISWEEPALNGDTIEGYLLQKWDGDQWDSQDHGTLGNLLSGGTTTNVTIFVDTALNPGEEYWYRIRTDAGTDSDFSVGKFTETHASVPDRPVLTATADGENAIDLSWTVPDDNGSDIIRYDVEVWNTASGSWQDIPGYERGITPSVTSIKLSGLTADTRYVYHIRAVNRAAIDIGEGSGVGPWSTLDFATTEEADE